MYVVYFDQTVLQKFSMKLILFFRAFLSRVIQGTLQDLVKAGGFSCLVDSVKAEKEKKARLQETILK